jgi:hypothetical protein
MGMFGRSNAHRFWRMMQVLIDAHPEWADEETFEQDRARLLNFGIDIGMTLEELFAIQDPKRILEMWSCMVAMEVELAD